MARGAYYIPLNSTISFEIGVWSLEKYNFPENRCPIMKKAQSPDLTVQYV